MRDDFPVATKELLAKRVGYRCSNPGCRQLTSGPQEHPLGSVNVGVAAHVTGASQDGPRFDRSLTSEQRRSAENGIWLCQKCAKLVDNDPQRHTVRALREWKRLAEAAAYREIETKDEPQGRPSAVFDRLEKMMPDLVAEMRNDLREHCLSREFVALKKSWRYSPRGNELAYYYDEHSELDNKLRILQNKGLIQDITYNNVARYIITEELADYLVGQ